jgi:replicative DNA helicase
MDEDAVRALGGLIDHPDRIPTAAARLAPDCFPDPADRIVFAALIDMHAAGESIDLVTLYEVLRRRRQQDAVGGPVRLAELWEWRCGPDELPVLVQQLAELVA